jgi:hypothetical protein
MQKKIAVLVRDRQSEALRMALGLILVDDVVDVYVLDRKMQVTGETVLHWETIKEMEINTYTNYKGNEGMEFLTEAEIAKRLPGYDQVLPY